MTGDRDRRAGESAASMADGPMDPLRRSVTGALLGAAVLAILPVPLPAGQPPRIEVRASPSCGCCKEWTRHLEEEGFEVDVHYGDVDEVRKRLGIPPRYGSCHTAEAAGYAIEGHVPAADIRRLLEERPDAVGLSVPAMPRGSPGMDGPAYGGVVDPYDVLLIAHDGSASVWQSYR